MLKKKQDYINRVHFKHFKSIHDLEIDLKPGLNIIIGPNGSGKTNFLEFLFKSRERHYIDSNFSSEIEIELVDKSKILFHWASEIANEMNAKYIYQKKEEIITIDNNKNLILSTKWRVYNDRDKLEPAFEEIGNPHSTLSIWHSTKLLSYGIPESFSEEVSKPQSYQFEIINDEPTWLSIFGVEASAKLWRFIFSHQTKNIKIADFKADKIDLEKLNFHLNLYSPIEKIRVDPKSIQYVKEIEHNGENSNYLVLDNLLLQFLVNKQWLYWNQLSDGTKRLFYLISSVLYFEKYILLEEPELGIHPDQLYKLMDFLKEQSKEKQIILTTHSPEVLNVLGKDELGHIIVTRFDQKKGTQMHHLSEAQVQKAKIFMEETGDLSDFWVHSNLEEYGEN